MSDPIAVMFNILAGLDGYEANDDGRFCERCGVHYYVVGNRYEPPYDRYCSGTCADGDQIPLKV